MKKGKKRYLEFCYLNIVIVSLLVFFFVNIYVFFNVMFRQSCVCFFYLRGFIVFYTFIELGSVSGVTVVWEFLVLQSYRLLYWLGSVYVCFQGWVVGYFVVFGYDECLRFF